IRGTPSCSTTSACLPMARKTWQHASADPMASPSGRACDVSTKRSRCSICWRTSCNILLRLLLVLLVRSRTRFHSLFRARSQFFHARFFPLRTVQPEIQFRRASQPQTFNQFMPYIFLGGEQAFEASIGFSVVAIHIHEDLCRTAVIGHMHRSHSDQPD